MKLSVRNIGKLKSAEIDIAGITVVAGENNTGKVPSAKPCLQSLTDSMILRSK